MEASELRIGNWINTIEGLTQIKGMTEEGIMATSIMDGGDLLAWGDPISLTEEWLLRFGFEKIGGYLWDCKKLGENRFLNNPFSPTHFEVRGFIPKSHIQYVHQLQNLYFALTGEELTIKRYEKIKSNN